ncbi:hypothetical protein HBB16_09070 [Pseudonocardia sp. MCCB 268]|nr:hypothetical protein [Pseudonocardia cytotoxica]
MDHPENTVARLVARGARRGAVTEAGRTWTVLLDPRATSLCVPGAERVSRFR